MKKVMRLVSVQLWAVMGDMLSIGNNRKKKPKMLYAGVLFFTLLMSGVSFFYSLMIGSGLKMYGSLELLPAMIMAVTCMIILMTTIFKVKGTIFGFRDYDMVMSLPVSTGVIAASRLIILYALNFMFVIIVMIPMMIAYGILAKPDILFYIISIVSLFFIPLLPIVIASFLGTLIAYAASKFRHSNIFSILFSLGFLVVIVVSSFFVGDNGKELVDMSKALTRQTNRLYPLARMYTNAVVNYDILEFLKFLGVSFVAFLLYTILVKRVFKKMNTLMMTGSYHVNYQLGQLKTSSPFKALYFKELKRYFSSTLYVINTGFGILMLTIGSFAIIFVDLDKIFGSTQATDALVKGIPMYLSFCIIMTCSTMASISLEGKNIWIIKSMPVTPKTVYLSKIAVNLTIISPAVIDTIIIGVVLKLDFWKTIILLLLTITCAFFISFYGLLMNLLLPNLKWTSEVVVIKQSAASMITIFSAIGYIGIQFIFNILIPSAVLATLGYVLLTVVIDIILYVILMNYGSKRYYAL
ncbi:MAG: hypothetical protein PHF63_01140 [Herbinix sp.]|nr:hypothetical protein [Herbinix sp.]